MFGYFIGLIALGDPRWSGGLVSKEMSWAEIVLSIAGMASMMMCWLLAMYKAHCAGRGKWALLILFVWPCAFVYLLRHPQGSL